jgi:hypothetical protein
MLDGLDALSYLGAVQGVGHFLIDVISASVEAVKALVDLPVDVYSLESITRLVKTSGFEDLNAAAVISEAVKGSSEVKPVFGLTIGGAVKPFSSATSSVSGKAEQALPASSSTSPSKLSNSTGFASVVPRAMLVFLIFDIILMVLAKQSALNACVSKLGIIQWVVGGIILGFPATLLVDSVKHEYSFRSAFVTEMFLLLGSFVWLCYGGSMVFNAVNPCVDTIAPLWWLSYASSVLSLSVAGTVIFCMVVTTVLSLIYGSTQSQ